jgi:hypothetical protein
MFAMVGTETGKESSRVTANFCERNFVHRDSCDLLVKLTFSCSAVGLVWSSVAYQIAKNHRAAEADLASS